MTYSLPTAQTIRPATILWSSSPKFTRMVAVLEEQVEQRKEEARVTK